jgi:hypothetical protein
MKRENQEGLKSYDLESQKRWRDQLGIPRRFPRLPYRAAVQMILASVPPTVFMREGRKTTDIVIRFNCSSHNLPAEVKTACFHGRVNLRRVFEEALFGTVGRKRNSLRSHLASAGYVALTHTWILLFRLAYVDQFYPGAVPSDLTKKLKLEFEREVGRRRRDTTGDRWLHDRYSELLKACKKLHTAVQDQIEAERSRGTRPADIPVAVRKALWKKAVAIRGGSSIPGGEVFTLMPYRRSAKFEDPTSWKPTQVAIGLLAIERHQKYQTIQRRLRLGGPRKKKDEKISSVSVESKQPSP